MASGFRFDRSNDGRYKVYDHGRYLGVILPDGRYSPSTNPKALKQAAHELERRGLLHADRKKRKPSKAAKAARARASTTRWGSRHRDPDTGRFA